MIERTLNTYFAIHVCWAVSALVALAISVPWLLGCQQTAYSNAVVPGYDDVVSDGDVQESANDEQTKQDKQLKTATFGAGCFWCVEAVFQELEGVSTVKSGYTGGHVENPTYKQICTGQTGHAEVCQIKYDPAKIEFKDLLQVFWKTHDPTTLNRQGADVGTQYRSAVFYHDEQQREQAEKYKKALDESGAFGAPIVTEIVAATKFYPCEDYHDNYFKRNPNAGY